ncbi:putative bifunctional diguanylate cyclase/phosphodiesterase [Oxalobacteraceae bacterium A2-2]
MNTTLLAVSTFAGVLTLLLAVSAQRAVQWRSRCHALESALEQGRDAESRLEFIAHHDALTGLPNRVQLQIQLQHGMAYARRHASQMAVLFIDIDRFKEINDTLGHDAGDQLLVQFARRLQQSVRQVDTVARQGGDEFIVLLSELRTAADAARVADKIVAAMAVPFSIGEATLTVAASVGIAVYPDDDKDLDALIDKADLAMYAAKQRGSGAQRFTPSMQARAYTRVVLETALKHALEHNEFTLLYQPRLDLAERRVCGVKVLLRWQHPELGQVLPADFMPVLENSALVLPVGAWVLSTVAEQARRWLEQGHAVTVSLTLSPRQFYKKDIAQYFAAILKEAGLPGRCIELDVAESILIDKNQDCAAILRQFRQLGMRITISGFGTGYASLNYLRRFPVDQVRLDKCFVDELRRGAQGEGGADGGSMVRAIIAMAHTLNMKVIAGGVENEEQLDQLRALGCDQAYGYTLGPPVAAAEVERLLAGRWRQYEMAPAA